MHLMGFRKSILKSFLGDPLTRPRTSGTLSREGRGLGSQIDPPTPISSLLSTYSSAHSPSFLPPSARAGEGGPRPAFLPAGAGRVRG